MAAAVGEVIFRAGEESLDHSDVWDDTALIEAYDRAVNSVKNGKQSGAKHKGSGKQRKQQSTKKKETKRHEDAELSSSGWQVGDACRAVFTEDEQVYDAAIVSIDYKAESCVVRYDYYENEEEQELKDLIPPAVQTRSKPARKQPSHSQNVGSVGHQMGDWSGHSSARWQVSDICMAQEWPSGHFHEAVINSFPTAYTCQVTFVRSRQRQEVNISDIHPCSATKPQHQHTQSRSYSNYQAQAPDYSYMGHMPGFSVPPPMLPPFLAGFCPTPSANTQMRWPPMPPVPTPVSTNSDAAVDEDALASMLMSWYLTGYHTGYYQALQSVHRGTGNTSKTPATHSTKEMNGNSAEESESNSQQE